MERRGVAEDVEKVDVFALRNRFFAGQHEKSRKIRCCLNKYITEINAKMMKRDIIIAHFWCLIREFAHEDACLCLLGLQSTRWSLM